MTSIVLTLLFTTIGAFAIVSAARSLTGGFAVARSIFEELYGERFALPATRRAAAQPVNRVPLARRATQTRPKPAACA